MSQADDRDKAGFSVFGNEINMIVSTMNVHKKVKEYLECVVSRPGMYFHPHSPENVEQQLFGMSFALDIERINSPNERIGRFVGDKWGLSTNCGWAYAIKEANPQLEDYSEIVIQIIKETFNIGDVVDD